MEREEFSGWENDGGGGWDMQGRWMRKTAPCPEEWGGGASALAVHSFLHISSCVLLHSSCFLTHNCALCTYTSSVLSLPRSWVSQKRLWCPPRSCVLCPTSSPFAKNPLRSQTPCSFGSLLGCKAFGCRRLLVPSSLLWEFFSCFCVVFRFGSLGFLRDLVWFRCLDLFFCFGGFWCGGSHIWLILLLGCLFVLWIRLPLLGFSDFAS